MCKNAGAARKSSFEVQAFWDDDGWIVIFGFGDDGSITIFISEDGGTVAARGC